MDRQFLGGLISPSSTLVQKDLHFIKCSCDSDEDRGFAEVGSGGSLLLTPHADGTASEVFRARPSSISNSKNIAQEATTAIKKAGGLEEWVCIKRVILEGQPKPHDVVREIRSLLKIKDLNSNIVPLLAAYLDTSDQFSTRFDLILPLYPLNLSQLLDLPDFIPQTVPRSPPGNLSSTSFAIDPIATAKELSQTMNGSSYIPYIKSVYQQLLSALSFLHDEMSISHRDIKPSNILLTLEGKPILTDFGTCWEVKNDLASSSAEGWQTHGRTGDDGKGLILPDVGSGSFRPPELMLSPKSGYDSQKVDMWELAVTISSFFTEVIESRNSSGIGGAFDGEEDESMEYSQEDSNFLQDSIPEWEKALFKGSGDERVRGPQEFEAEEDLDLKSNWAEQRERDEDQFEPRMKSHRATLFDSSRGDIGLMGSIFNIRGLSKDEQDWPEAIAFQPNLSRMPFSERPSTNLIDHLPLAKSILSPSSQVPEDLKAQEQVQKILELIDSSLQLSASKRPTAKDAIKMLE